MSLYNSIKRKLFPTTPGNLLPNFTPQFRLEGRARTSGADSTSLAMRVADPLWMLGRQWQFGEFQAEDNGSPIAVSTFYSKNETNYYSLGTNGKRQKLGNVPPEVKVEAMAVATDINDLDLKSKVRLGQRFERLMRKNTILAPNAGKLIADLRKNNPLTYNPTNKQTKLDAESQRFFGLMQGKVIDIGAVINSLKSTNLPPRGNAVAEAMRAVLTETLQWYQDFYEMPAQETAWNQQTLAHQFKLHGQDSATAANDFTLNAPDYQSGDLDWYSFDTAEIPVSKSGFIGSTAHAEQDLLPLNVSFPSMPNKRLFAFEDSKIDLSKMDVEPGELLKTMLIDFSLVSGSDWYTVPLKMQLGQLCWLEKIKVKDVFGVTTEIKNDGEKGAILNKDGLRVWDMFKIRDKNIATYAPKDHFMFLAPAATMRLESEPLEELLFLRDEYANMVWAVERRVLNAMGKSMDGFDLHLEVNGPFIDPKTEDSKPVNDSLPVFKLMSTVPSNWIPYLPQHINNGDQNIALWRATMPRNDNKDIKPLTTLAAKDILKVREEAIPRAGVRVQVTNQRVRWTDGKTYLWRGRKVLTGRGEGNSGLQFDYLKE